MSPRPPPRKPKAHTPASPAAAADRSLLDVVDNLLNQGVVISGDAIIGVADVDLIYLRLSALLCAADRVLPGIRK